MIVFAYRMRLINDIIRKAVIFSLMSLHGRCKLSIPSLLAQNNLLVMQMYCLGEGYQ
jgi:hypothetical protein